ncbi:3' terminal RNA ribose 2'-O-methyltransferase Hen1 [Chitinophaga ginsengisegetis]|uniref:3' terminal RNA ribose 2'-O-methyltransferase Hen1 n=1 Tax=Chitinophaga ginsengisegetis TaxID=393003 RepID=UPI000DBAD0D9|nr:3' terminal RNA ribose 2'-O-methyltransferase Hen1 [Chitinophaga ginsengisegetis]MDR6567732.1 3' terminal RNA ribose 2'-O-methyltransferase Hen1 [Chitinophaga ginsengisegetis]MDR6647713.1 3' terminal RNA ribose 2'-O-methyltransferase Hen1 [Chitinophaga ginsengisegetis]MDR6654063.1 3' terminal RNA ribose 2'-O-methyltransferase Hen1 [Chitinophaga ginsengisegetis]
MLLTITTKRYPATDLGYLLHKHPAKVQTVELTAGSAHIFYPEATDHSCTAALLLDIDPVRLVRGNGNGHDFALEQYVNDRPYVASSFMSAAISQAYATAMNGRCKDKPHLVDEAIPFEIGLSVLPVKGGEPLLRQFFEPLGYEVNVQAHLLDEQYPAWGQSRYFNVTLRHTLPLKTILKQLYILVPVCDNDKHYFVGGHEIEKLMEKGEGWLDNHPAKELITRRYLRNIAPLAKQALELIMKDEVLPVEEKPAKDKVKLHDLRLLTVRDILLELNVSTVADMGCGEGKLLRLLMEKSQFKKILGMDVSYRALEIAQDKVKLDRLPEMQRNRIQLIQGSLTYRDKRLEGFDAGVLVEVIEHLDESRLQALEKVVFEYARPAHVIITTVNAEYNVMYEKLTAGAFRHGDHRFEWTRAQFETWANRVAAQFGYIVSFRPLGEIDETLGGPSQLALFKRSL